MILVLCPSEGVHPPKSARTSSGRILFLMEKLSVLALHTALTMRATTPEGSRSTGSFVHVLRDPSGVVALIVNAVCKARTLSFSIRNKILPEDVRALFGGCTPSDGHRTRIMKIQRSEWLRQVRLFRAYLRAQMHRTYESYAAEIHFRKHLRLADQMIEFHWKLQLRLLRDLVDKVRVSATSNVHVAEGICLPDFVLEVLELGPKFAVQPQKNKPELVSIVRQVSKRVPEDQATRIINEVSTECGDLKRNELWRETESITDALLRARLFFGLRLCEEVRSASVVVFCAQRPRTLQSLAESSATCGQTTGSNLSSL
ncbi:hypothetical protein HPB51_018987 [Rhipicephalus microplus]|uniref:Tick transposon n=1 Tax=Rhipicephalus microplus TaxID=6941 RepID=A0A9J6D6G4_RHIMP|nr:hypothetical protein HPB51_018987 [Rhipicephalus microplus]